MKFTRKSWITVAVAIIAVGLVVYIVTRSMKKEGMTQHLSVVSYSGNEIIGQMKARDINATPVIWDDPHGGENWEWEEKEYNDKAIYLVSRNRQPVEELLLDFTKGQYLWKPDPNKQDVLTYQITGAQ